MYPCEFNVNQVSEPFPEVQALKWSLRILSKCKAIRVPS